MTQLEVQQKLNHIDQKVQRGFEQINLELHGDTQGVEHRTPSVDQRFQDISLEVVQKLQDYQKHMDQKMQYVEQTIKELKVSYYNAYRHIYYNVFKTLRDYMFGLILPKT